MAILKLCSVPDCDKISRIRRGYCDKHYARLLRHGDPLTVLPPASPSICHLPRRPAVARLWLLGTAAAHEDKIGCLTWPFCRNNHGYAVIRHRGRMRSAAYVLCERVNGIAPSGDHETAHSCGKGHLGCVNPHHLSWKTHAENMAEKATHGTNRNQHSYRRAG